MKTHEQLKAAAAKARAQAELEAPGVIIQLDTESEENRKLRLRDKYKDFASKALAEATDELPLVMIENILFQGRRLLLSGQSKGRKTWLCMLIAFCISKGFPVFGRFKTQKSPVLFVNLELLEATAKQRFRAIAEGLDYKDDPFENLRMTSASEYLDKIGNDFSEFLILEATEHKAKVVCVDPVWRLLGERDENAVKDIGAVLRPFAAFSREAKASTINVHHYAKGNAAAKDPIDRPAGSGAWARDAHTLLMMTNHKQPDTYTIEIRTNDFLAIDKFVVRFNYPIFELAPELDPGEIREPGQEKKAEKQKATKSEQQAEMILALLYSNDQEGGLTHAEIVRFTTYPKSSVTVILKRLVDRSKIIKSTASADERYMLSARFREEMDRERDFSS